MDLKLLKLLLEEMKDFPFLHNKKSFQRKDAKGKREHKDAFIYIYIYLYSILLD